MRIKNLNEHLNKILEQDTEQIPTSDNPVIQKFFDWFRQYNYTEGYYFRIIRQLDEHRLLITAHGISFSKNWDWYVYDNRENNCRSMKSLSQQELMKILGDENYKEYWFKPEWMLNRSK